MDVELHALPHLSVRELRVVGSLLFVDDVEEVEGGGVGVRHGVVTRTGCVRVLGGGGTGALSEEFHCAPRLSFSLTEIVHVCVH